MAEFCFECFLKQSPEISKNEIILSDEPDLCEGCGEMKPVVEKLERFFWSNIF